MMPPKRLAWIFALLLTLSTVAFVVGVTVEKNQEHSESTTAGHHSDKGSESQESPESDEASESHESADGESDESTEGP
jgi:hypothetical protein